MTIFIYTAPSPEALFALQDEKYRDFQAKLIPTVTADSVIGVRTPEQKNYLKTLKVK